ncbi:1506_t:CDS:2 [Rhizophagus irregularis]|nr:1506_t:CDS:2 [Rhizophagus irregularis]
MLYLYRNLSNSFQNRLLTLLLNNDKNNDENKIKDKIEKNKEIDKIDKNEFNQENNDGLKYQPKQEESSSSKDKKEMDNFLFNFSLNELKKSLSQTISLSTISLSSTSSLNNEIAKCLINYTTNIGKHMLVEFNKKALKFYNPDDMLVLKIRVLDEKNISRDPYRHLCVLEFYLPCEGAVLKERQKINEEMAQLIPISIINVNTENQVD